MQQVEKQESDREAVEAKAQEHLKVCSRRQYLLVTWFNNTERIVVTNTTRNLQEQESDREAVEAKAQEHLKVCS